MNQQVNPNEPQKHSPRIVASTAKPRRHRPVNPFAVANALALRHQDIADKVAGNFARRTRHSIDDLRQIAMLGITQAARRYDPKMGSFRPYARTYANGEIYHYLRKHGFPIAVPQRWRELYARAQKLIRQGMPLADALKQLKLEPTFWREICEACRQQVVSIDAIGVHSQE